MSAPVSPIKPIVFFDFDGVIVANFEMNHAIASERHPGLTKDEYREMFHGNINFYQHPGEPVFDLDTYFEKYTAALDTHAIMEQMDEAIALLAEDYTLIIVTSSMSPLVRNYLLSHDLAHHFTAILGTDVHKSKVEKMQRVIDEYHVPPSHCLFVTDTLGDLREGHEVSVKCIAVSWGFHHRETLEKGESIAILDSPSEIKPTIDSYFSAVVSNT
jgi:phosphoglycolate phosphatase